LRPLREAAADDVLLNKAGIIQNCLRRVDEEYAGDPQRLTNLTHQDAIVLSLERACQATIDMAMHAVAREKMGVPQSNAQAFDLLAASGKIGSGLAAKMRRMVGFRNLAIHQYQDLRTDLLLGIIENARADLSEFCALLGFQIS
jgi:uncharacterized protein YutE (UPF0331/DUF86 family)